MIKKRILLLMYALLLCVTASFAWIIIRDPIRTKSLVVDYHTHKLMVSDKNIELSIWVPEKDGFAEISNSSDEDNRNELFRFQNIVPDYNVSYQIRIKNNTSAPITIRLSISSLSCADKLINVDDALVYLSVRPGNLFKSHAGIKLPEEKYMGITDQTLQSIGNGQYSLSLYDGLQIPPTGDGYVELECYFYFSKEMDNSYQNLDFRVFTIQAVE